MKQNTQFRHESLQDNRSVERLLNALVEGIAEGNVVLEDEDGVMSLSPQGLAHLKISASEDEDKHRLDLRFTWRVKQPKPDRKELQIRSGKKKSA